MQSKATYNRPLWSGPSLDPVQRDLQCTKLPFLCFKELLAGQTPSLSQSFTLKFEPYSITWEHDKFYFVQFTLVYSLLLNLKADYQYNIDQVIHNVLAVIESPFKSIKVDVWKRMPLELILSASQGVIPNQFMQTRMHSQCLRILLLSEI